MASFYEAMTEEQAQERIEQLRKTYAENFGVEVTDWQIREAIFRARNQKMQDYVHDYFADFPVKTLTMMSKFVDNPSSGDPLATSSGKGVPEIMMDEATALALDAAKTFTQFAEETALKVQKSGKKKAKTVQKVQN